MSPSSIDGERGDDHDLAVDDLEPAIFFGFSGCFVDACAGAVVDPVMIYGDVGGHLGRRVHIRGLTQWVQTDSSAVRSSAGGVLA